MADNLIRMQCPIWERSSQPGKVFRGSIAFDSSKLILQVYDDDKWPSSPFPELALQLAGADIKLKPITSRITVTRWGN